MVASPRKRLFIAYVVVAIITALTMLISASGKLTLNQGAVHIIHDVIGVPMRWFPALAACELAGGIGLVVGIFRPKIGVAAAIGLVLYFVGAMLAHVLVKDWAGLKAPIMPLVFACAALTLRLRSMRRE